MIITNFDKVITEYLASGKFIIVAGNIFYVDCENCLISKRNRVVEDEFLRNISCTEFQKEYLKNHPELTL